MGKGYCKYDCLRYELFETLLPEMLYRGTEKEKDEFFSSLKQDGKTLIHDMYKIMCEDDGMPYPYGKIEFGVEAFERGGVNILQILLPPYNPNISDILRAYILYMERGDGRGTKRYFVVKRFKDGNVSILYVNAEMEVLLGEDLTGHIGDMEYEYHKLVSDYAKILILELGIK